MIQLKNKQDCCGCGACAQRCPKQCITMRSDEEGFLYPHTQTDLCVQCGICEKVCPIINQEKGKSPLTCFASFNKNENIRCKSSSGGIFTLLAELILSKGGVVFGARFNEQWDVIHDYTESKDGLASFRGAKYVQSNIGRTYIQAEQFLKAGRKVLFSGTPCQIAGLHKYLRKEYKDLFTIEIVCHGVPSPMVWHQYIKEQLQKLKGKEITHIEFRDKRTGWKHYSFRMEYKKKESNKTYIEYYTQNPYIKGFIADIYLRPSCYSCPSKSLSSGADITIGDFWGIQHLMPEIDDNKGICCILINSPKGNEIFKQIKSVNIECNFLDIVKGNPAILHSPSPHNKRTLFLQNFQTKRFIKEIEKITRLPLLLQIKISLYYTLKKILKK